MRVTIAALIPLFFLSFLAVPVVSAEPVKSKSALRLAGKAAKKIVLPVTLLFAADEAHAAYTGECSKFTEEGDRNACAAGEFAEQQYNDVVELVDDTRIMFTYVVKPKAEEFWEEHGDKIESAGSSALDYGLTKAAKFFNWLNE